MKNKLLVLLMILILQGCSVKHERMPEVMIGNMEKEKENTNEVTDEYTEDIFDNTFDMNIIKEISAEVSVFDRMLVDRNGAYLFDTANNKVTLEYSDASKGDVIKKALDIVNDKKNIYNLANQLELVVEGEDKLLNIVVLKNIYFNMGGVIVYPEMQRKETFAGGQKRYIIDIGMNMHSVLNNDSFKHDVYRLTEILLRYEKETKEILIIDTHQRLYEPDKSST